MRHYKITPFILLLVLFASLFTGCVQTVEAEEIDLTTYDYSHEPVATIELESGEIIKISLFTKIAPNTVNNFIALANDGFYDGTTFHRVMKDFMIQGGDPLGTGMGGPGYSIKGEFNSNGFPNGLEHTRGVLSMARTSDKDSAGSQFFIMHKDTASLDGDYASFGYVTEGIEVVDQIAMVNVDTKDKPLEPVIIKSITIELNGYEPENPIKL
jgi:Peptidyl-prolyl cis-trans isomerase (rotamase) - cyclophilin family